MVCRKYGFFHSSSGLNCHAIFFNQFNQFYFMIFQVPSTHTTLMAVTALKTLLEVPSTKLDQAFTEL